MDKSLLPLPYNTGKVQIGSKIPEPPIAPMRYEMSATEIKLQRALLARPRPSLLARLFGRS
jgi:hypothetical protein